MKKYTGIRAAHVALGLLALGFVFVACTSGSPPALFTPQCTSNSDCPTGQECSANQCVGFTACAADTDCAVGSRCFVGVCRQNCVTNADCGSLICDSSGECVPAPNGSGGMSSGGSAGTGTSGTGTSGTGTAGTGTSGSGTSGGSAGTGTAGSGGSPSGPTEDLVDDLEDADGRIIVTQGRQGNWFTFSDGTVNPAGPNDTANTNGFA
ncbi:MAG TPA: hypothetical protein VGM29_14835, partial [Polyangiaceae bacterium]